MQSAAGAFKAVELGKQWTGQTVDGRFPLQQYLGGSETSAVFLTQAPASANAKAAIKLVLASAVDAEAMLASWKRAAQLSHPHLMPVLDGGRTSLSGQQLLFVVTEYAEENLAQVIPQRALTVAEADAMLRPVVAALAHLHHHGLVHGHVSPSNVMALGDQLKLSSDGIRPAAAAPRRAQSSAYDAPEIQSGKGSAAADIWSLGAMLVESLTQHIPGGKADVVELPRPYAEIVRHCLVSNPSGRWTADEIAGAIHLKLDSPRTERRTEKIEKIGPAKASEAVAATPSGRFSRPAAVAAMLVVFAVIAILFAWRLLPHESAAPAGSGASGSEATPQTVEPAQQTAPAPEVSGATRQQSGVSAEVVHRVMPNASRGALSTIQGRVKVRLRLNVDAAGHVADARFVSPGPSKYFSRVAMEGARQWKFSPASPSEWNLLFEFSRSGVEAFPGSAKSK